MENSHIEKTGTKYSQYVISILSHAVPICLVTL